MDYVRTQNVLAILCFFFYIVGKAQVNAWGEGYEVHVVNGLPNNTWPLRVHCFSGSHEIGYHNLRVKEEIYWHLKMEVFENTKYYCHFWWHNLERGMGVFNARIGTEYCGLRDENQCWWLAKEDGFYIANVTYPPPSYLHYMNWWVPNGTDPDRGL